MEANSSIEHHVVRDLSYLGHFLFVHAGGRSGKQRVLSHLYHFGGRLPQRQMVEHAGITPAALSEVLAKLESEGLVVRTRSEQDRRQLDVVLTPKGIKRARQTVRWQELFEEESLAVLSDAEKSQLKGMLDRLVDHWDTIEKTHSIEARLSKCTTEAPDSPEAAPVAQAAPKETTPSNSNPTTTKGA